MNALTETQLPSRSNGSSAAMQALMLELAKCLKLVAPAMMGADAQMVWLQAAADALEGIRADEVATVSAEIRRSVTRPAQIVPAIAEKVAEKRAASRKADELRYAQPLPPPPERKPGPPLTSAEIAKMPKWLKDIGLRVGFLKREGERLVDFGG